MGFFLSKSLVFLLSVALLVCCSYADHESPQRREDDPKLMHPFRAPHTIPVEYHAQQLNQFTDLIKKASGLLGKRLRERMHKGKRRTYSADGQKCEILKKIINCSIPKECEISSACVIEISPGGVKCYQTCSRPRETLAP